MRHEWKGAGRKARALIAAGIFLPVPSMGIIGAGVDWKDVMSFLHSL